MPGAGRSCSGIISTARSDKLEEELVVRVDFESWDDSLPSYLKVVSRLGQGRPLDPGDLPKAGIEAIGDLAAFFPEPIAESLTAFTGVPVSEQVVASTIETLKKGAGHMVDQAFREDLERRAAAARRGEALLSSEDTRLLEAEERRPLVERAILDQLQAMNAARRDEHPEVVGRTIRFFHSRVPTCERRLPDLDPLLKTIRIVDDGLVDSTEVDPCGTNHRPITGPSKRRGQSPPLGGGRSDSIPSILVIDIIFRSEDHYRCRRLEPLRRR